MIGETRSDPTSDEASADLVGTIRETPPPASTPLEIGGRDGPDPTRYGDWEKNGRCIDF
jgi:hypothetical protein